jgi:protein TonB
LEGLLYPLLGVQAQLTGTVKLRAVLGSTGSVVKVEVLSGHPILAEAAQENLKRWGFALVCEEAVTGQAPALVFTWDWKL